MLVKSKRNMRYRGTGVVNEEIFNIDKDEVRLFKYRGWVEDAPKGAKNGQKADS